MSKRKQCKKICSLAGRRKRRVLEERQDDEKVIHSKALLLAEIPPPAGPSPRDKQLPLSFLKAEAVLPTNDEDDDFQVAFCFSLWCHDTDSPCGFCRISEPSPSDHSRGGKGQGVANSS